MLARNVAQPAHQPLIPPPQRPDQQPHDRAADHHPERDVACILRLRVH